MDILSVIKKYGFSQVDVATAIGSSKSSFNHIVKNPNTSINMLRKIAGVLGCSVAEFFEDERTEDPGLVCPKCGTKLKLIEDNE